jgi:hypothetical protein
LLLFKCNPNSRPDVVGLHSITITVLCSSLPSCRVLLRLNPGAASAGLHCIVRDAGRWSDL